MVALLNDPEITSTDLRTIPTAKPTIGIGVVEAPRGTLFHHYETDEQGLITKANLIVATQNNAARIAMSVDKAARGLIKQRPGQRRPVEHDRDGVSGLRPLFRLPPPTPSPVICRWP